MSKENLLEIKNMDVRVDEREILKDINLTIGKGETHVLMGPNGTGKSTLGYALAGNPRYQVTSGEIWFHGKNIVGTAPDERAREGLFLSFQNPIEVPGITLSAFIRSALEQKTGKRISLWSFKKELKAAMDVLQMAYPLGSTTYPNISRSPASKSEISRSNTDSEEYLPDHAAT